MMQGYFLKKITVNVKIKHMKIKSEKDFQRIAAWLGFVMNLPALIIIIANTVSSIYHLSWINEILDKVDSYLSYFLISALLLAIAMNFKFILNPLEIKRANLYVFSSTCLMLAILLLYLIIRGSGFFYFVF